MQNQFVQVWEQQGRVLLEQATQTTQGFRANRQLEVVELIEKCLGKREKVVTLASRSASK